MVRPLPLTIERMGQFGDGVGRLPDGRLAFIPFALPGETVSAVITEEHRHYVRGNILTLTQGSPERVQPLCPIFGECGGCALQHWQYDRELAYKENRVHEALRRQGLGTDVVGPIRGSVKPYGYRNKGQFPFALDGDRLVLGLYRRRTHQVIPATHCDIQDDMVNTILEQAARIANAVGLPVYDELQKTGLLRHLLIRSSRYEERTLVLIVAYRKDPRFRVLADSLLSAIPQISGVGLNINNQSGNRVLGPTTTLLAGSAYITETVLNAIFRLSFTSFFQVNPEQAAVLYDAALEFLPDPCVEVWDLYSGVGTLASLAARRASRVRAVEINPDAVSDAQINFSLNDLTNITMEVGRVESIINSWVSRKQLAPDAVIVDPPRAGLDPLVIQVLLQLKANRVIYVSCNPETWSRDIARLGLQYQLEEAVPVDMFPRTDHVEVASWLSLRR